VSGQRANNSAQLISPSYNVPAVGVCFKFWYNMYGSDINTLSLWMNNGGTKQLVRNSLTFQEISSFHIIFREIALILMSVSKQKMM
jgi:hypothetical protein